MEAKHTPAPWEVIEGDDEIVCGVSQGVGSVEELEALVLYPPPWAHCPDGQRWPVGAAERYRKD